MTISNSVLRFAPCDWRGASRRYPSRWACVSRQSRRIEKCPGLQRAKNLPTIRCMLLYKDQIHLAAHEVRRITLLTGEAPQPTMAIEDYYRFLDRHLARFGHDEIRSYLIETLRFTQPYVSSSPISRC
jgi:hypothetical protein